MKIYCVILCYINIVMEKLAQTFHNRINYPYLDYIVKSHVPQLQSDKKYRGVNMDLFHMAMIHHSCVTRGISNISYERLEYLGDAVFHLVITEYLYDRYDEQHEGFLTKLRIRIENGESMADLTKKMSLDQYIVTSNVNLNTHILEDVFEAFIGAFYLEFGMVYTKPLIVSIVEKYKNLSEIIYRDNNYKDILLRYFHQMKWGHPIYHPVHSNSSKRKKFRISVSDPDENVIGVASGTTKKKAEQKASKKALEYLGVMEDGVLDPDWLHKIDVMTPDKTDNKTKGTGEPISIYNPQNKPMKKKDIASIIGKYQVALPKGVLFNYRLFQEAMTHRSYLKRSNLSEFDIKSSTGCVKLQKESNERLQFLGDTVIHFVIGEFIYHRYPEANEGFMTRLRCKLENRDSLFNLSTVTGIANYVLINQIIEIKFGRNNPNIMGRGFEAFIGAMYLELGLHITRKYLLNVLDTEVNVTHISNTNTNYKDQVLQLYNDNKWGKPVYKLLEEYGPDHNKSFMMGIYLNNKLMGRGVASTKKKAEQLASKQMYKRYRNSN